MHVKLDTGMGRLGTRDLDEALAVAAAARDRGLLVGAMTHFATSDDDPDFAHAQLEAFAPFVAQLGDDVLVHAANSAERSGSPRAASTWCAAGWPSTASTRSRTTPPTTASSRR